MTTGEPRREVARQTDGGYGITQVSGTQRLQLKVGGMSCSFCVASITKALRRMEGVQEAGVNLAHEDALVVYDPEKVSPASLKEALLDLGSTVRDARKVG